MMIKDLPVDLQEALDEYFFNPYSGYVYIYNGLLVLKDLEKNDIFTIMMRDDSVDGMASIWKTIFTASRFFAFHTTQSLQGRCIIDVGAKIGHFSLPFATLGADVRAVEIELLPCRVMKAISVLTKTVVTITPTSIQEAVRESKLPRIADLILMLNVFDHILRQDEREAWHVLNELSMISPRMVLMMGPTDKITLSQEIPEAIIRHSQYKKYTKLLSESYGGRDLWGFTR